jgi:hypothetical protein
VEFATRAFLSTGAETMKQDQLSLRRHGVIQATTIGLCFVGLAAWAPGARATILYNNDTPNTSMAAASRPANGTNVEIEAADDFLLTQSARIDGATFTGLLPAGAALPTVTGVAVEIYRVFPLDSAAFDNMVPTRTNSPSDNAFTGRDSAVAGQLNFSSAVLNANFTATNSVLNGINKSLTPATGGEGSVSGQEVQFTLTFPGGIALPADHYFFKPEVGLSSGSFLWLAATRPYAGVGAASPDLQAWIRNTNTDPDWLRIGTDIVGGASPPTFNMAFSLNGVVLPEPASVCLLLVGAAIVASSWKWRTAR